MIIQPFKNSRRIIIEPGEFYVTRKKEVISTLLGSCVSACLFDPLNNIIGMNHFLLAYRHHAHHLPLLESEEGRYGIYAMELLINEMMKQGANRLNLKAKCFGGGNVLKLREDSENRATVGEMNVEFIKEFIGKEKIPLLGSCLGGNQGRNVHFFSADFAVFVKKIGNEQLLLLENEERRYWKKNLEEHSKAKGSAEFW